jgi:hypothetical protein
MCCWVTAVRAWGWPPGTVDVFLQVVPPSELTLRAPEKSTPKSACGDAQERNSIPGPSPRAKVAPASALRATPSGVVATTWRGSAGFTAKSRACKRARSRQAEPSSLTRSSPFVLSYP